MTQSLEDYLEMIYIICNEKKICRVKDISDQLKVRKPSVLNALKELEKKGLAVHERYGYIELTESGITEGQKILDKHHLLTRFLVDILGVPEVPAEEDACNMEHFLSDETIDKIKLFMNNGKNNRLKEKE